MRYLLVYKYDTDLSQGEGNCMATLRRNRGFMTFKEIRDFEKDLAKIHGYKKVVITNYKRV